MSESLSETVGDSLYNNSGVSMFYGPTAGAAPRGDVLFLVLASVDMCS